MWNTLQQMSRAGAKQLATAVVLLFVVSAGTFGLLQLAPGDAASLRGAGSGITEEQLEAAREELGLDRPVVVQYGDWLADAVTGDLGNSLTTDIPVTTLLSARIPVTLSLAFVTLAIIVPTAVLLGVLAAAFEGRLIDRLVTGWASMAVATPTFWLGLILALVFAVRIGWVPAVGYAPLSDGPWAWLSHLVLPAITLAVPFSAAVARQLRVSLIQHMSADYVLVAEAKGLSRTSVLFKHALRNASLPAITLLGLESITLVGGAVVVEAVFALPGLGTLAIQAVQGRDIPVILGVVLLAAVLAVLVTTVVDVSYRIISPRTREG